jgi:general L-amino acid transport system permease protein
MLRDSFATPGSAILSLSVLLLFAATVPGLLRWALIDAVWRGGSGRACEGIDAACWVFIRLRVAPILYGGYPTAEHWRVNVAGGLGIAALLALLAPGVRHKTALGALVLLLYPPATAVLLCGGAFGLATVPTNQWGGLMLTLVVAVWTIATSLPLGLLLAFARRSRLPVVAAVAAGYVDVLRGLPLIGILFVAIVMFPLFVPPDIELDKLLRALLAFTLFNAANFAEVLRGGLQAVPRAQAEAGAALGLRRCQGTLLVVIPQAISASLPGIVNVCVSIAKETTVILIVGLFDFLGALQAGVNDPHWLVGDQVRATAYLFAGSVYWVICFSLSRYSARIERSLNAGRSA